MSLTKTPVSALALPMLVGQALAAGGPARDWQLGMQPAVTPVMSQIQDFHRLLLYIITGICIVVALLLIWVMLRFNSRANPTPSKTQHNTFIEIVWTGVPILILVLIAIPSFRLLYFEATIPKPDVTIQVIGRQWYWTYVFPKDGGFQFDSNMLKDEAAARKGEPRLLGVDNPVVVPVNKVVEVETTASDVIHSWAVPAFGVKMDAIPGHLNHTWFKATQLGTYYGQCSELCGANHAFMPIEVKVVTQREYETWLAQAKKKYAADDAAVRVASK